MLVLNLVMKNTVIKISFSFSLLFHKTSIDNGLIFHKLDFFGIQQSLSSINWITLLNESHDINTFLILCLIYSIKL